MLMANASYVSNMDIMPHLGNGTKYFYFHSVYIFSYFCVYFVQMRTNIVLDEQLIREAMLLSNSRTKKEVVDLALQNFVAFLKRRNMKDMFGKIKWDGDLEEMRGI